MMTSFAGILAPLLLTTTTNAQSVSLKDAQARAERNSPALQRAAAARDEARWKHVEANATWYPSISGTINYLLDKKYVLTNVRIGGNLAIVPGIVPTTTYGLSANYNLFDGFASTNRERAARRLAAAAEDEYRWADFELKRQVALQYYRALAAQSLRTVAESNLKTLKDHLNDVNQLRRNGLSTNYDVLRVEVQVSEAESELLNATDNISLAAGRIGETLGTEDEVEPTGELPEFKPDLINGVGREPSGERADLRALAARTDALALNEKAGARHWVPQVSAFGTYTYYNNLNERFANFNQDFRNAYQYGLQLTWNLFDGLRGTARANQFTAQKIQGERQRRSINLKARQDLNLWTRKFKYFALVSKSRQNDIGKATESVRLAREGHRVGARTNTDLLDAEAELYRAQAGAIAARLGAAEALINVELALGQPLAELQ